MNKYKYPLSRDLDCSVDEYDASKDIDEIEDAEEIEEVLE